jgi:hypothetical protein
VPCPGPPKTHEQPSAPCRLIALGVFCRAPIALVALLGRGLAASKDPEAEQVAIAKAVDGRIGWLPPALSAGRQAQRSK